MKINFILSHKERAFLEALYRKDFPKNRWSGRGTDDAFRQEWAEEIKTFKIAGLTVKTDDGSEWSYWEYGLNKSGLALQKDILGENYYFK